MTDADAALAALSRSASWPWGSAVLHLGYRAASDTYQAVLVEGGRLLFASDVVAGGDFSDHEFMYSLEVARDDVTIVDDDFALLTVRGEHARGGSRYTTVVLARDGSRRGEAHGALDRAVAPRREGTLLRLRCAQGDSTAPSVQWIDLTRQGPPLDPIAHAARAHGYALHQSLLLDGRCPGWRAREVASGREVAVLALPPMDDATREAVFGAWGEQTGSPLPDVLTAHGWCPSLERDGPSLLVFDAPPGVALASRVTKGRPLPTVEARAVIDAVSNALGQAHRRGRAHGFLARDRVWLAAGSVRLVDVGLERAVAAHGPPERDPEREPMTGIPWAWAAPEVFEGRCDARSDVWSLAQMAFWMRTGVDYWRVDQGVGAFLGELMQGPRWLASRRAQTLGRTDGEVPGYDFDEWFRGCVARDPGERFADIAAAAAALPWEG